MVKEDTLKKFVKNGTEGLFVGRLRKINHDAGLWGDDDDSLSLNDVKETAIAEFKKEFTNLSISAEELTAVPNGNYREAYIVSSKRLAIFLKWFGQKHR